MLIFNIFINVLLLYFFKYFNFTIDIIENCLQKNLTLTDIILPVGISFYTFQAISYVVDVYRQKVDVQTNIFKFALYISFFPQLVAGPIVRYSDFQKNLEDNQSSIDDIVSGIKRFILGLAKKVILADGIAVVVDSIWILPSSDLTASIAWLGAISYAFQIYFDFSGYSDMAIGLGKIFGFHLPKNFNFPYMARTITDFWRRWHISLSEWFRDYVYIPLGGNKKNQLFNIFIVFF